MNHLEDQTSQNKSELRRQARRMRNSVDSSQRLAWSEQACLHLCASELFLAADLLHVYRSFGSELQTERVFAAAFKHGKRVCVPRVSTRVEGVMTHQLVKQNQIYRPNHLGVPEPILSSGESAPTLEASAFSASDLIVVPLLAYDLQARRLGYGGGYYDRFLSECPARKIGLAFANQLIDMVPHESHDVALDAIVTEAGLIWPS